MAQSVLVGGYSLLDARRHHPADVPRSMLASAVPVPDGRALWNPIFDGPQPLCTGLHKPGGSSSDPPESVVLVSRLSRFRISANVQIASMPLRPPSSRQGRAKVSLAVAETRAVNGALRKAYGIGVCSVEEIGAKAEFQEPAKLPPQPANGNGNGRTVRDRLCQVIRQYQLNANLVKAYATDSCGVKTLRDASREQVEHFVTQLADWAEKDLNAIRCQLNSYAGQKEEVA